ncbi:MAG: hypothetical protein AABX54_02575 [Nanoarchaeota archaeon]
MLKFWRLGARRRIRELEEDFIRLRNSAQEMLFDKNYFYDYTLERLENQALLVNGASLRASRLADNHKSYFTGKAKSDPNYEQLMIMYTGIKMVIQREKRRREYSFDA